MTIKHKVFVPYTVLKAQDMNDYLMNQSAVSVDTAGELTSIPAGVAVATVKSEGRVYVKDASGIWAPVLRGKVGGGSVTTNASGDLTVTHGLGVIPASVSVQDRTVSVYGGRTFAVNAATATTFTARAYYNSAAAVSATFTIYWRVDV